MGIDSPQHFRGTWEIYRLHSILALQGTQKAKKSISAWHICHISAFVHFPLLYTQNITELKWFLRAMQN